MVYGDPIENLKDLLVLIKEECGNPNVVVDGGDSLEILTKERNQVQKKPEHVVTNAIGESISLRRIWNIVIQLGEYDFSCGSVVNNLKECQLSDQMNRNCFDLILARRYWNCSNVQNLRYLNSAANQII